MPRKQFVADLESLVGIARKSDEDGSLEFTTASGAICSIIYLSTSEYPASLAILTTDDDGLAKTLATLGDITGTISEIMQAVNELCSPSGVRYPFPHKAFTDGDNNALVYFWCRIPFSNAELPETVLRAMNISKADDLLMCLRYDDASIASHALIMHFFCVNQLVTIHDEDVKRIFRPHSTAIHYRQLYFEWTLIDYATTFISTFSQTQAKATLKLGIPPLHLVDLGLQVEKRLRSLHTSCVVCHQPFSSQEGLQVIKPTVCTNDFCGYQFVEYGLGADIPYQIRYSPHVVDMLIQFTYAASASTDSHTLESFPLGLGDKDAIAGILDELPAVTTLQEWIDVGGSRGLVSNMDAIDKRLYPLLRWILCTNTSFIEEIDSPCDQVTGVAPNWKQFKIASSSLTKEHAFQVAKKKHSVSPQSLYAFHGSGVQNWHSILRNGLHYKKTTNGRAYGNGIYHSLNTATSINYCRKGAARYWKNSTLAITGCFTLNELVNCPKMFVDHTEHLVIGDVDWVQLRYIFVTITTDEAKKQHIPPKITDTTQRYLDLAMKLNSETGLVRVPAPDNTKVTYCATTATNKTTCLARPSVTEPTFATPFASKTIMREIMTLDRRTLRDSKKRSLASTGDDWLEFDATTVENLYQWTVHIKNFDKSLPIAADLSSRNMTGITLEISFGPNYPIAPPFIRVLSPRMLQFCNGGGGHVTAGGSICMDLLTDSGWLPSYSLESVLLQVKMALSSLDPRPARIDPTSFNKPYSRTESWNAFTRVAKDHGWKVDTNGRNFYT